MININRFNNFSWQGLEDELSNQKNGSKKFNMAYDCVDKHSKGTRKEKVALRYIDETEDVKYTFEDLKLLSNKFANILSSLDINKGDNVFILSSRRPEFYICLLGIIKAGAAAAPLPNKLGVEDIIKNLNSAKAEILVSTYQMLQSIPVEEVPTLKHIIVIDSENTSMGQNEVSYEDAMSQAPHNYDVTWMNKEDGLVLYDISDKNESSKHGLFTHGTLLHLVQSGRLIFELNDDDVYWCTADHGWSGGIFYSFFTPLLNGVTAVIRGGKFSISNCFTTLEECGVTKWITSSKVIKALMGGEKEMLNYDISKLKNIYNMGEPLNPEINEWLLKTFGIKIYNIWCTKETGGIITANLSSQTRKMGSIGKVFPGIEAAVLDNKGKQLDPYQIGKIAVKSPWPSMINSILESEQVFKEYFSGDWFVLNDLAYKDEDGYIWYQGNSGEFLSTLKDKEKKTIMQIEAKLIKHPAVREAGITAEKDSSNINIITAFVSLNEGYSLDEALQKELQHIIESQLKDRTNKVTITDRFPVTLSGKKMRRTLSVWDYLNDSTNQIANSK